MGVSWGTPSTPEIGDTGGGWPNQYNAEAGKPRRRPLACMPHGWGWQGGIRGTNHFRKGLQSLLSTRAGPLKGSECYGGRMSSWSDIARFRADCSRTVVRTLNRCCVRETFASFLYLFSLFEASERRTAICRTNWACPRGIFAGGKVFGSCQDRDSATINVRVVVR